VSDDQDLRKALVHVIGGCLRLNFKHAGPGARLAEEGTRMTFHRPAQSDRFAACLIGARSPSVGTCKMFCKLDALSSVLQCDFVLRF